MERRRSSRFGLTEPMDAHVSVLQDVQVEHTGIDDVTVLSSVSAIRGEKMMFRVGAADEVQMTMAVRVVKSDPYRLESGMGYRVQLAVEGSIALGTGEEGTANVWRVSRRITAALVREYAARVINVGRGGCLIETSACLPEGTVARVHRERGSLHADAVRIAFAHERRGAAWTYANGAEFLSVAAPSSSSLRTIAHQMEETHRTPFGAPLVRPRQESSVLLTNAGLGPIDILSVVCAELEIREPVRAVVKPFAACKKPGRRLALVEGHQDTPGT